MDWKAQKVDIEAEFAKVSHQRQFHMAQLQACDIRLAQLQGKMELVESAVEKEAQASSTDKKEETTDGSEQS